MGAATQSVHPGKRMSPPLKAQLSTCPWIRRTGPFPHVLVPRLFIDPVAAEISAEVTARIADVTGMHHFGWYDAYACGLQGISPDNALAIFVSRAFHDFVADRMEVPALGYVNAGIHSHRRGSESGFIHNDLNPVYFDAEPRPDAVVLPTQAGGSYMHGSGAHPGARVRRVVRCTTMIYYTGNPNWHLGDGGETGLYSSGDTDLNDPDTRIPPLNNSMLIFNCSSSSYHAFLCNRQAERNSIVMWLHASVEHMSARHGEQALVPFRR